MRQICALLFCCLIAGLLVSSCDRTSTDSSYTATTVDLLDQKLNGVDYFPNTVGTRWDYQVYNFFTEEWEPVAVEIIGYDTLEGIDTIIQATVWESTWDYKVDTQYVVNFDNTVLVFPTIMGYAPVAMYKFPLEDGATWTYQHAYGMATTTVYALDTCSSCTRMYNNCFDYYTHVEGVPFDDECTYWGHLAPNVGMVRGYRAEEFNYSIINYDLWELLKYHRVTGPR